MTGGPEGCCTAAGWAIGRQLSAVLPWGRTRFLATYGIGKAIDKMMGLRASEDQE